LNVEQKLLVYFVAVIIAVNLLLLLLFCGLVIIVAFVHNTYTLTRIRALD